ncbi:hypothetical protein G7051_00680 [Dysgonomonas sp. HDW5B]|uniref:hypothetical protein n=1 Tax=Dysgonomonas sp. HDW5B TaxID=2714927 RepID=UPI001409747C|nr:hypothetical protein [Dysgonomonas sp. HDW5B]QIK52940.1 hypothetical protein G7051_00680 [Dysgonomonas sp. HDW5B]
MLNLAEVKVTLGITPELEGLLTVFLGYLTSKETPVHKQKEQASSKSSGTQQQQQQQQIESTFLVGKNESDTSIITVDMLRSRVKELISADQNNRDVIEAKFAEYDASNPTSLHPKYYQEYWMFLNELQK